MRIDCAALYQVTAVWSGHTVCTVGSTTLIQFFAQDIDPLNLLCMRQC